MRAEKYTKMNQRIVCQYEVWNGDDGMTECGEVAYGRIGKARLCATHFPYVLVNLGIPWVDVREVEPPV